MKTSISLLLLILFSVESTKIDASSDTLVFLHVLFRHGNRTPDQMSLYPTDPNANETYAPFGYSQLTIKGKKTEYEIGKYLRHKYGDLIPEQYTPNVVYAISTNFKRTKMSLELVLAGLFPPLETDIFADGLNWQPIPFNVDIDEHLIAIPLTYCVNFARQYYKYILSKEGQKAISTYTELYQLLSEYTGSEVATPDDVITLFETLKCEEDYGLELPEWTRGFYPEILEDASALDIELSTVTPGLRRLTTGNLLKKILDDSFAAKEGILPQKISLYSAHDWNVGTILNSLNVYYKHIPPFGATVFFEIHNIDGTYGLQLYYQDYVEDSPRLLTIPGCSSFCELDDFAELIADNLPGPYDVCSFTGELM